VNRTRVRASEVVTAGYLGVTGVLAGVLCPPPFGAWCPLLAAHAVGVALLLLLFPRLADTRWVGALRDWLPAVAIPILYIEVAQLNQLVRPGYHDASIRAIDLAIFGVDPRDVLQRWLPWHSVSQYLHFSYATYYLLLPLLGVTLYAAGRRVEFRYVMATVLATFYICFLCYVLFPVAGPWYDLPHVGGVVDSIIERGASKGAAFPSSHVAVSIVIWLLAWRFHRTVFWILAAVVPTLILGTVYGGYHYAIDAIVGLVVGIGCYLAAPWIFAPQSEANKLLNDSRSVGWAKIPSRSAV
jgi:membrane-associated phospholipid phosphatase